MQKDMFIKVDQYIHKYVEKYQPYHTYWNYEDGCVLSGAAYLYEVTKEPPFSKFILNYLSPLVAEDGTIINYEKDTFNIDSIHTGNSLFFAYEMTKEERYLKAIAFLAQRLQHHPRTKCGNFWHKSIYPYQIWLDGLYMAQPFYMHYETLLNGKENYQDILNQFLQVRKYLFDEDKHLYYHAYDEARVQVWANKKTGLSPNFWLRSIGWYVMALMDVLDHVSVEIYEVYDQLRSLFKEAIQGILAYQDPKSKLFYQVVDHPEHKDNYLETSGSAMIGYSILKACNLNILSAEKYLSIGQTIFQQLVSQKLISSADSTNPYTLTDICKVAGLGPKDTRDGSVAYYLSEPRVADDAKGTGPFMMAYAQYLKSMSKDK